ncbi:MAG TPA: GNAT family N-acetyltransferase [Herpetosiphonaceae bacterium]|nr:GNAT family N-acetyltransferase [Herpetosiphonaceae bacterium]
MPAETITVRALETDAELATFYHLAASTFARSRPPEVVGPDWRRSNERDPRAAGTSVRGTFRGGTLLGGCIVYERLLRLPPAELRTACIGAVVTGEEYRKQGVARAVLDDVISFATKGGCSLLLLDGIAHFYNQWGFVDVVDMPVHSVERAHILELPPSPCSRRPATPDDAAAMAELYRRHFDAYDGSFERTVALQEHRLRHQSTESPAMMIVGPGGETQGYFLGDASHPQYGLEIIAETWPAALAALHYHTRLLDSLDEPPSVVKWLVPMRSPLFYLLADRLWIVSETCNHRNAGWMARTANLPNLFEALLPRWSEQWRHARLPWGGRLTLDVDGASVTLDLSDDGARQVGGEHDGPRVRMSQEVFTQLLWGFRPVSWARTQPDQHLPPELMPVLEALFAPSDAWIPWSDSF